MAKRPIEQKIKVDAKCGQYKHGICLATVDHEGHTRIPQACDPGAAWCKR